jgi:hypothetical protein
MRGSALAKLPHLTLSIALDDRLDIRSSTHTKLLCFGLDCWKSDSEREGDAWLRYINVFQSSAE